MPSHPPAPDPLRQRMLATETSIRAAERCVRQLHLHHAAYLTRTVVADACRVVVEVEHGELTAIDPERGDTLATWRDHAAQAAAAASSAAAPIIAGWYSDGEHFLPDHCLPGQARDGDRPCR